jgi:DNA-binding PadR family transcriptional regulator
LPALNKPQGLAIKQALEDDYEKKIHHGRLYPNLDTLVDKGLLKKGELDNRTNVYTVMQCGLRDIQARRAWEKNMSIL